MWDRRIIEEIMLILVENIYVVEKDIRYVQFYLFLFKYCKIDYGRY